MHIAMAISPSTPLFCTDAWETLASAAAGTGIAHGGIQTIATWYGLRDVRDNHMGCGAGAWLCTVLGHGVWRIP